MPEKLKCLALLGAGALFGSVSTIFLHRLLLSRYNQLINSFFLENPRISIFLSFIFVFAEVQRGDGAKMLLNSTVVVSLIVLDQLLLLLYLITMFVSISNDNSQVGILRLIVLSVVAW